MKVRLFIPGRFEEAFLYMDRVAALDEEHALQIYDLQRVVSMLSKGRQATHRLLTYALLRSDPFGRQKYAQLSEAQEFRTTVDQLSGNSDTIRLDLDSAASQPTVHDTGVTAEIVLDMNIYNRRIYLATNRGLFHLDVDWEPRGARPVGNLTKRFDAHCLSTTAKYATVSVSCGDEGLFAAPDDFSWYSDEGTKRLQGLAAKSLRSSWFNRNLVNYGSYRTLSGLFKGEVKQIQAENLKRYVVTEFDEQDQVTKRLVEILEERGVNLNDIGFISNSNGHFFVQTYEEHLYIIRVAQHRQTGHLSVSIAEGEHELRAQRVLSVHSLQSALVVETDSDLLLLTDGNLSTLVDSEVISVKTFPTSRHYENVVAVVTEEGLELIGFLGA